MVGFIIRLNMCVCVVVFQLYFKMRLLGKRKYYYVKLIHPTDNEAMRFFHRGDIQYMCCHWDDEDNLNAFVVMCQICLPPNRQWIPLESKHSDFSKILYTFVDEECLERGRVRPIVHSGRVWDLIFSKRSGQVVTVQY